MTEFSENFVHAGLCSQERCRIHLRCRKIARVSFYFFQMPSTGCKMGKQSTVEDETKKRLDTFEGTEYVVAHASGWDPLEFKNSPGSKFAITGNENQVLTVALGPNETCKGEPGSMMYLSPGVTQGASCDGCCERCLSGESCFVLNFTNSGSSNVAYAAMTPNEPLGKVIPVDLSSKHVGGVLIVQQGTYMGSYGDVDVRISLDCKFMRCCCGGAGLIRQKISGTGTVFLGATGTIMEKILEAGEVMIIDTNCILAFSESCQLDIKQSGGIIGMIGGGEGIFNTTLTGPGLAIVQSMNKQLFLGALAANKMYRR